MARAVLINYANGRYKKTQHFNSRMGKLFGGFDQVIEYGPEALDDAFMEENRQILDEPRGAGLWLWKPYIILKTLEVMNDGDYLFYCDAGAFFIRNVRHLIETMGKSDIWISDLPLIERQWTKHSIFTELDADRQEIKDSQQMQAGFILLRKTAYAHRFISTWLEYMKRPGLLSPMSDREAGGECIAHREDQSILSVLCKLEHVSPHKDPTQFGRIPEKYWNEDWLYVVPRHDRDRYPVCVILHRTSDVRIGTALRQWACSWLPLPIVYRLSAVKQIDQEGKG